MTPIQSPGVGTSPVNNIMMRLREGTQGLHEQAEHAEFQKLLGAGTLPQRAFVASLGQLWHLHKNLDSLLRSHAVSTPSISKVIDQDFFVEEHLAKDLRHFGWALDAIHALPETATLNGKMTESARIAPVSLLGFAYVFAGSMNGNRFIARVVRQAYRLAGDAGTHYLDPYGDRQRQVWDGFKDRMNALELQTPDADAIVASGRACFQGVIDVYAAVYRGFVAAQG